MQLAHDHAQVVTGSIRRMRRDADVVITCGGLLACRPMRRTLALPVPDEVKTQISSAVPVFGLPSCQLESVLLARFPDMPPTSGLVDIASARAVAKAMPTSIEAAACHVGVYEVPPACLEACQADQIGTPH